MGPGTRSAATAILCWRPMPTSCESSYHARGLRDVKAALAARDIVVKALSTIADMLHRLGLPHKTCQNGYDP